MWPFVNENSATPLFVNVLQHGPPPLRREGILSRLRSLIPEDFLFCFGAELFTYRAPCGLTRGQSYQSSLGNLGSGPGVNIS